MRFTGARGLAASVGVVLAGLGAVDSPASAQAADSVASVQIAEFEAATAARSDQGDAQAAQTLDQFKALSGEEKERFVKLINDPDIYKQIFEVSDQVSEPGMQARIALAEGDVVVEVTSENGVTETPAAEGQVSAAASTVTRWASHTNTDKVLGIKISATKVTTNYQTRGKDTTKVLPGTAQSYEYIPGCSLSHGVVDEWISAEPADNAQTETIWTADCAGSSWDGRQRVWGDYRGYVGGYLKVFK
ncbi:MULTISPECIES: hypothetical protein [unclassified Streptomyces]|uniref:hypothetical protein n=1 Tax=unclassified Streptomyces TaxID=2593676 RepID=UPI00131ADAB5|nr:MULTISPECIES: hypothetical protein [unclassified Streptomyces]